MFNCTLGKHDFEKLPEHKTTQQEILAAMHVNSHFWIRQKYTNNRELTVKVCVLCGHVVDERSDFRREVQSFIEEKNLLSDCRELRLETARKHYKEHLSKPDPSLVNIQQGE